MDKYYNLTSNQTIENLNSNKEGLDSHEASTRLARDGLNKLKEVKKKSIFMKFLDQFKNVMLIILIMNLQIHFLTLHNQDKLCLN